MSIRFQLLLIALTTLVLPWAGCQYARDLETTLRRSQENSLQAAADTISNALSAQPQRVFSPIEDTRPFDSNEGDLYVFTLHSPPLLDGYREDWDLAAEPTPLPANGLAARLQAGVTERYLFLYLEVDDPHFDPEPSDVHPLRDRFDRVNLTLLRPDGAQESYFFGTGAPGLIEAQRTVTGDDGADHGVLEPRIQAYWLQSSRGYHLEARIPRSMLGSRLWVQAIDGAGEGTAGVLGADGSRGGRLVLETPGLNALLATFIGPGTRATVVDADGLKLGTAGTLNPSRDDDNRPSGGSWYRRFVSGDISNWPLQTAAPDRLQGKSVTLALAGHRGAEWLRASAGQEALLPAAVLALAVEEAPAATVAGLCT